MYLGYDLSQIIGIMRRSSGRRYILDLQTFNDIKKQINNYKYNSLQYTEFEEVEDYEVLQSNDQMILLFGENKIAGMQQIHWAASDVTLLIDSVQRSGHNTLVSFVPKEWKSEFDKQGFGEYLPGDIKYKDVNGDGLINNDDRVAIGSTRVPNLVYGLCMSMRWTNFDFNIHFQGSGKSSYFLNGPGVYPFSEGDWGNILTAVSDPANRWISRTISGDESTENTNAMFPRLSYGGNSNNYRESTFWLRDGSYLRLKTLELGYSIPQRISSKLNMNNVRFYLIGNNLFLWDKLKIWDPELGSGNGMAYPPMKSVTLGLTFNI